MKRYKIIYRGRVQGVGFRWQCKRLADSLGITGEVKNLFDGSVSVYIQGNNQTLKDFFKGVENFSYARIGSKVIDEAKVKEDEKSFEIVY